MGKGKLLFKGDRPKKKKKSKSKHLSLSKDNKNEAELVTASSSHQSSSSSPGAVDNDATVAGVADTSDRKSVAASSSSAPTVRAGSGKITTSGTVVTGYDGTTKFEKEVAQGDALLCVINGREELRVITMRLSNVSLNLSSPFSQNLSIPTSYQFIKQPRDKMKERKLAKKKELETKQEREQHAYDLYQSTEAVVYREKTETGSYRIKRDTIEGGAASRGRLLELRAKKSSDKYC